MLHKFLKKFSAKFASEEDGAVTVDWVVITAAVVILVGVMITIVEGGTLTLAGSIFS